MATEAQHATQAKRILVVEDEVMIRMLLEDMLGELGYAVAAEAARIDEALEATKNADFDIAICKLRARDERSVASPFLTFRTFVKIVSPPAYQGTSLGTVVPEMEPLIDFAAYAAR
jgi:hypothetical protein